jgi:hypothetical protein
MKRDSEQEQNVNKKLVSALPYVNITRDSDSQALFVPRAPDKFTSALWWLFQYKVYEMYGTASGLGWFLRINQSATNTTLGYTYLHIYVYVCTCTLSCRVSTSVLEPPHHQYEKS